MFKLMSLIGKKVSIVSVEPPLSHDIGLSIDIYII